ncbi:putative iron/zinc purple acid phosphatase-like protein isoform X2 [Apostichopus japonicus]|uniref:Purple acid phosphatase n=1 Tax=Stichopus japonicus TaxID=307972 RepID=A0A2G8KG27_STIJA|nr:putative iron/zinc purple acid phosphatase-like protein isoform X2 [Apostichopus japonicus]
MAETDGGSWQGISKATAEKLHILYGGIGPVIIPEAFAGQKDSSASKGGQSVVKRSAESSNIKEELSNKPEQIHLAYGETPSEMVVMWSTGLAGLTEVRYGLLENNLNMSMTGEHVIFTERNSEGVKFVHRVKLANLLPGTQYYYLVKTNDQESEILHFTTMKDGTDWSPTIIMFGDMGTRGGSPSLRILNKAALSQSVDAIIHTGDFAYDLHEEGGKVGDDFMNRIQYAASRLPYMTCVGNHEIAWDTFSHYRYRFSMPGVEWPTPVDRLFYSFDMGPVHFISYSTEVHFAREGRDIAKQVAWLQEDLQEANTNRNNRPWVIAFGHRPMYCSNNDRDDCTKEDSKVRQGCVAFEKLFYDEGVDIIVEAHEHSYERFWPMYGGEVTQRNYTNPRAPVHIIGGAAGCNEFDKVCINPIFGPKGPWSAFRSWFPGLYGVGKLFVVNATHLHWQQLLALNEQTLDHFWIHQEHHGPFPHRTEESTM